MRDLIILVCPPFAPLYTPSLALSTLKVVGETAGAKVCVHYSNLDFAGILGVELYDDISAGRPSITDLAGEWIFAGLIGGSIDEDAYIDGVILSRDTIRRANQKANDGRLQQFARKIRLARSLAASFVEIQAQKIVELRPAVVGFTSVFQQTAAGLAMAAAIKRMDPSIATVFGGPNYEGPMGVSLKRNFKQIDEVVSGEGEDAFRRLASKVARRPFEFPLQPIAVRERGRGELDTLPFPNFDEYFSAMVAADLKPKPSPHLVMETSRGCWWGERSHCTFCGLNGSSMRYRSKSPARALKELRHLVETYGALPVDTVDNILDMDYFKSFVPELQRADMKLNLFYETKSNLSRKKLEQLAASGIRRIQPGIESLSDDVLRLMGKGVSSAQNLSTIKWCQELGIHLSWNFLWGFPGEDPQEYSNLATTCPALEHLTPPDVGSQLRLDRFSPLFEKRDHMGLCKVSPYPAYRHVFSTMSEADIFDVAYYFTFSYKDGRDVDAYARPLTEAIEQWRNRHSESILLRFDIAENQCLIFDTRRCSLKPITLLGSIHSSVLSICSEPASEADVLQNFVMPQPAIEALKDLLEHRLIIKIGRLYLSLPHCFTFEDMPPKIASVFQALIDDLGGGADERLTIPTDSVGRLLSPADA